MNILQAFVFSLSLVFLPQIAWGEKPKPEATGNQVAAQGLSKSAQKTPAADTITIDKIEIGQEITNELAPLLAEPEKFTKGNHEFTELKAYYEKNIKNLAGLYAPNVLGFYPDGVMAAFSGKATLTSYDVFYVPYLPLAPEETMDLGKFHFFKIKATFAKGEVPGLRAETTLVEYEHILSANVDRSYTAKMRYVSSLNARVLGFSYGQLIPSLSSGVQPAKSFEYNGIKDWNQHSHLKKDDQISHPIKLTNVSHGSGSYDISTHPDFALEASFEGEAPVVMTFFLWQGTNVLFMHVPPPQGSPPDFIFQLVLRRTEKRKIP